MIPRPALSLFLALAWWSAAQAAAPNPMPWDTDYVEWTQPAGCFRGDACPLQGYEIQTAATATATFWTPLVSMAPTARNHTVNGLTAGQHCYRIIALISTDILAGKNSDPGNVMCLMTPTPVQPHAPLITVSQTAYKLDSGYVDQYKLSAIGLVPFAAPCKPQEVLGLNVVSRKLLKPDPGKSVPLQVLAKCGPA